MDFIEFTLDGPRRLRFTANHIADMEDGPLRGLPFTRVLSRGLGFSMAELRALLWTALRPDDPKIRLEEAGDILQGYLERGGSYLELAKAIQEAVKFSGFGSAVTERGWTGARW